MTGLDACRVFLAKLKKPRKTIAGLLKQLALRFAVLLRQRKLPWDSTAA
jgi:hypothetical protein